MRPSASPDVKTRAQHLYLYNDFSLLFSLKHFVFFRFIRLLS